MATTSMIVMEPGASWPARLESSTTVVALSHPEGEILRQTEEKLDTLERHKQNVEIAVLACNAATGEKAPTRPGLARALLGAVSRAPRGRLILAADGGASLQLRMELLTLAGELSAECLEKTVTVSLWFNDRAELG